MHEEGQEAPLSAQRGKEERDEAQKNRGRSYFLKLNNLKNIYANSILNLANPEIPPLARLAMLWMELMGRDAHYVNVKQ